MFYLSTPTLKDREREKEMFNHREFEHSFLVQDRSCRYMLLQAIRILYFVELEKKAKLLAYLYKLNKNL